MEWTLAIVLMVLGLGLAAGFAAGFLGVGGGLVMVPVLLELYRHWRLPEDSLVQAAMATSLAVAVFSTISAAARHHRQGRVLWRLVPYLVPGSAAGGWLAARIATQVPGRWLQLCLAALMALAAVRMLTQKEYAGKERATIRWHQGLLVGLGVGMVAGMSGLAGGIVLVPAMALLLGVPTGWLAGTSSAVIVFSALAAALGYLTATPPSALGPGFVGYANLPVAAVLVLTGIPAAQAGAWVNLRTGSLLFRRICGVVLLLVVARLVWTG